jgi:predicted membrane protein
MKKNQLTIFLIVCIIIAVSGVILYQWFLAVCVIVFFCLALFAWHVIDTLSAIRTSMEKIEQHLEGMKK